MSDSKEQSLQRASSAVIGGLVGDAASLGVHWIYGDGRVGAVVGDRPEFLHPDSKNYRPEGPDYFAHRRKGAGDFTHYGEHALILLRSIAENKGQFNLAHYANLFKTHFGAGGDYVGYVDHCMRSTLFNMALRENPAHILPVSAFKGGAHSGDLTHDTANAIAVKLPPLARLFQHDPALFHQRVEAAVRATHNTELAVEYGHHCVDAYLAQEKVPVGADDHQMNALAKMIPLIAARHINPAHYPSASSQFRGVLDACVRVTQNNDLALAYLLPAAFILELVIKGYTPKEAVLATAVRLGIGNSAVQEHLKDSAIASRLAAIGSGEYETSDSWAEFPAEVAENIGKAIQLAAETDDSVSVTGTFGRSCFLRMGVPSAVHILLRAASFTDGVRRALLGGGDSAGRANFVGAVLGAHFGFGGDGVPAEWVAKTRHIAEAFSHIKEARQ